eukprot:6482902-Amphidinium_carterae.1
MWGAFAVLASAILEVLGLAVKFALELVDLLIFGTDYAILLRLIGLNAGRAEVPDLSALFCLVATMVLFSAKAGMKSYSDAATLVFASTLITRRPMFNVSTTLNLGYISRVELPNHLAAVSMCCRHHSLDQLPPSSPSTATATSSTRSSLPSTVPVQSVFEIHLGCQTDHFPQLLQHRARRVTLGKLEIDDFSNHLPTSKGVAEIVDVFVKRLLRSALENANIMSVLVKHWRLLVRRHLSSSTPRGGDGSWETPFVLVNTPGGRLVGAAYDRFHLEHGVARPQEDQGAAKDSGQQPDVRFDFCGWVLSVCFVIENTLAEWSEDLAYWEAILPCICYSACSSQPEQGRRHTLHMVWFVRKKTKELPMTVDNNLMCLHFRVRVLLPRVHPDRGQDPSSR